ncbi:unnamed protein product [Sphagnum balticum]
MVTPTEKALISIWRTKKTGNEVLTSSLILSSTRQHYSRHTAIPNQVRKSEGYREKELSEKQIPFVIRRYLPDSSFEDWKLSELRMLE